jgi:hypothetical protein
MEASYSAKVEVFTFPCTIAHVEPLFRNLVQARLNCHTEQQMPEMSEAVALAGSSSGATQAAVARAERPLQERPFRVKLRGSILTLLRLPNRREIRGKLHQLSITGGLLNLEKTLEEKLEVELIFQLGEATVRQKAQMMFPMWATQGWLQPFRFVDLPEASKNALEKSLLQFVQCSQERGV